MGARSTPSASAERRLPEAEAIVFTSELTLRAYEPNEWVVVQDLRWVELLGPAQTPRAIVVPRGFITDLASIPRPLRGVLNVNGRSRRAGVLHDYLYCSQPCTRAEADAIFRRALAAEGINLVGRNTYYGGVRAAGWIYWHKRAAGLGRQDFVPAGYWEAHP